MRKTIFLLALVFGVTLFSAAAESRRQHFMAEFQFSPTLCQQLAKQPQSIHLQALVLNLKKHRVYFFDDATLASRGKKQTDRSCVFRQILSLEKGDYLMEFLFYDEQSDRFELAARGVTVGESNHDQEFQFKLDALFREGFKQHRAVLIFKPSRTERAFKSHMLWSRVRRLSLRSEDQKPDLYVRFKVLSANMNYPGISYMPDEAKADWIYALCVRTDNLVLLSEAFLSGKLPVGWDERKTLKAMSAQVSEIKFTQLVFNMSTDWDRKAFEQSVRQMDDRARRETLADLAHKLEAAVAATFFSPGHAVSAEGFRSYRLEVLTEKIETAVKILRKKS